MLKWRSARARVHKAHHHVQTFRIPLLTCKHPIILSAALGQRLSGEVTTVASSSRTFDLEMFHTLYQAPSRLLVWFYVQPSMFSPLIPQFAASGFHHICFFFSFFYHLAWWRPDSAVVQTVVLCKNANLSTQSMASCLQALWTHWWAKKINHLRQCFSAGLMRSIKGFQPAGAENLGFQLISTAPR